jgi:hypothetical protein
MSSVLNKTNICDNNPKLSRSLLCILTASSLIKYLRKEKIMRKSKSMKKPIQNRGIIHADEEHHEQKLIIIDYLIAEKPCIQEDIYYEKKDC